MEDKKEDTYKVIEPKDNCALLCRSLDKLVLVNAHAEVVDTIRAVLDKNKAFNGEIKNYSRITCAFVLNSHCKYLRSVYDQIAVIHRVSIPKYCHW